MPLEIGGAPPYSFDCIASCDRPLLPCVDVAVVLTMANRDDRLRRLRASGALRLARVTYAQINPGWRSGTKPSWVRNSANDIAHAYRNVCAACRKLGHVLILEDDAETMAHADDVDFAHVDAFLREHRPRAYTLGSVGLCTPRGDGLHWNIGWACGVSYTHAIVWGPDLREALLATPEGSFLHIDGHFLSRHVPLVTYYKPLVAQTFPVTENMRTWCFLPPSWPRALDRLCIGAWVRALHSLGLDRDTRHWATLYAVQCYLPLYVGLLVLIYGASRHAA